MKNKMNIKEKSVWPCTIIPARYGGCYEGGKWLAFNLEFHKIPREIYEDDITCSNWFVNNEEKCSNCKVIFGKGDSPQEAYENLILQL